MGSKDEYVADPDEPECLMEIVEPKHTDPEAGLSDVADRSWRCIRIEKTAKKESDGWILGRFSPTNLVCVFLCLREISSIYQTYQLIVNPLTEKLGRLQGGESIKE